MRKMIKIAILCIAAFVATNCGPNGGGENPLIKGVIGEWHLVESPLLNEDTESILDIYVEFKSDNTFVLYQKDINAPIYYNVYDGTYLIDGAVITGKYSDGKNWGASNGYKASIDDQGRLTLINVDNGSDISVYAPEVVPEEIKASAVVMTTRGEEMFDIVRYL